MGDETSYSHLSSEAQELAELEAEFQRELERNAAALRLLKERADEARLAKSRAELSQQKMECMKNKYSHVFDKLEQTRKTLKTAQERIDRQNEIHNQVKSLRDRADVYADKLNLRSNNGEAKDMLFVDCPDFDFPQPLINYAEEEEKERQMEEERKLLLAVSNSQDNHLDIKISEASTSQIPATLVATRSEAKPPQKIDYAKTVQDLQEKLSKVNSVKPPAGEVKSSSPVIAKAEQGSKDEGASDDHDDKSPEEPGAAAGASAEEEPDEDALAIFTESVQRTEARCAGIHEQLGRMALSEQYMRTKQAQLRAKKKEMEAKEAMLRAEIREREAAEMRRKVEEMMKLLAIRKDKLKVTEHVTAQKGKVVDNVNKILNGKMRKENYVKKQRDENLAFGSKKK